MLAAHNSAFLPWNFVRKINAAQFRVDPDQRMFAEVICVHIGRLSACSSSGNDAAAIRASPCSAPRINIALHPKPIANFYNQRHRVRWAMKRRDRISEREHQGRLETLLKSAFNTQLQPLRSLKTATKKRRALKKRVAENSGFTKSSTMASG